MPLPLKLISNPLPHCPSGDEWGAAPKAAVRARHCGSHSFIRISSLVQLHSEVCRAARNKPKKVAVGDAFGALNQ